MNNGQPWNVIDRQWDFMNSGRIQPLLPRTSDIDKIIIYIVYTGIIRVRSHFFKR